jgi:cell division protein FtsL
VSRSQRHVHSSSRTSRPSLRVVRRKKKGLIKRGRARRIAPVLVLLGIFIAATVGTVLLEQVVLAQSAFKLAAIRKEVGRAEEKHGQLLLEAAKLGSSERIKRVAIQDLGMVPPEQAGGLSYIVANVRSDWSAQLAETPGRREAVRAAGEGIAAQDAVLGAEGP